MIRVDARAPRWLVLTLAASLGSACKSSATTPAPVRGVTPAAPAVNGDASAAETTSQAQPRTAGAGEQVAIHTADNWTLAGEYRPGDNGLVVLLVHQLASNRSEWGPLVARLQPPRGPRIASLAIDLRGHGLSTHGPTGDATWQSFGASAARWAGVVDDVAAAVTFLRSRPQPPGSIVIVGSSIGSSAALRYAATDPQIQGVVLLSPGLDYRGLDTRDPMARYASTARPALLLASDGDTSSAEALPALLDAAREDRSVVSVLYPGTGAHGVAIGAAGVHPELWERIDEWIRATLTGAPQRDH